MTASAYKRPLRNRRGRRRDKRQVANYEHSEKRIFWELPTDCLMRDQWVDGYSGNPALRRPAT